MKKAFLSLLLCLAGVWQAAAASIWLADLRCENLTNPLGIDNTAPRFSWKVLASDGSMSRHA